METKILSEQGELFAGPCKGIIVPAKQEEIAILPFHTPMVALMGKGRIKIMLSEGVKVIDQVKSGIVHVENNKVVVLVNL